MNSKNLDDFYSKYPIRKININGKNLEYIVSGTGRETFVILPGGGQSAQSNFRLIQSLENKYKVIALTIYNFDSIKEICFVLNSILQKEKVDKFTLYGLSIGGLMAQSYLKRNKSRVTKLILSQCCTPKSQMYQKQVFKPLMLMSFFLPILPLGLIKYVSKIFAGKIQGVSANTPMEKAKDHNYAEIMTNLFSTEFQEKYFDKVLLRTWINLHKDFSKETFTYGDFSDWKGEILILRSVDDPLVQDEGDFQIVYPKAKVFTFHNTGHLSYYFQFPKMISVIKNFLI